MQAMGIIRTTPAQREALAQLPVEFGSVDAPHPNILRALVRRELAAFDYSANSGHGEPPEVVITDAGKAHLQEWAVVHRLAHEVLEQAKQLARALGRCRGVLDDL